MACIIQCWRNKRQRWQNETPISRHNRYSIRIANLHVRALLHNPYVASFSAADAKGKEES